MPWTLSNPYLPSTITPTTSPGGLLSTIAGGTSGGGPLATVNYAPPIAQQQPTTIATTGTLAGSTYTVTTDAVAVFAVGSSGGAVWRPAVDVEAPQPGEFVFNPYTGAIELTLGESFELVPGQAVSVIAAASVLTTDLVQVVPPFAKQVQLRSLSWGVSVEEHPGGSLEIQANDVTLPAVKSLLSKGTEFSLYGIGFRCGQMRIATASRRDFPVGLHVVSIALEGKWQNYVEEPYPWRKLGQFSAGQADAAVGDEVVAASVSLVEIAAAVGAVYQGPAGVVPVPENAGPGESTTFAQEVDDFTRINASVIDYSSADAIRMKPIAGGRIWDYRGAALIGDTLVQDVGAVSVPSVFMPSESLLMPEPVPGLPSLPGAIAPYTLREEEGSGVVIEWENVQLTGEFSEVAEADESEGTLTDGDGRSRWVKNRREITVLEEGDTDATLPPAGAIAVRDVSLNFDQSGPTKTLTRTRKEDGFIVLTEQWRYGYAFTAREATNDDGELRGVPAAWWKVVEYTRKERAIDRANTGYAYGWNTTGWRLGRFKQETATNPETLGLDSGDPELNFYTFRTVPIAERERELLRQHRDYYDIDVRDQQGEVVQYTLPDGTQASTYLRNPNYAEPMFVASHSREMIAFISTPNPDSADDAPLPPLISGREEFSRMARQLEPGRKRRIRIGGAEQPGDRTPDRYTDYSSGFTAQDGQYDNSLEDTKFQDYEGRPGEADRLPPEYTQEAPPEGNEGSGDTDDEAAGQRLYLLNSGAPTQTLGQQLNYPRAATLEQGLTAARTDATLENLEQGTSEQVTIAWNDAIRPGDMFIYEDAGEVRRRWVQSCEWQPEFDRDGMRGVVVLSLARWVDAGALLSFSAIDLPASGGGSGEDGGGDLVVGNRFDRLNTLGGLLPLTVKSRTRGNY